MQVSDNSMVSMPIDVLKRCEVLPQFPLDERQALQYLLEGISLEHHDLLDVVDLFAVDVELGDDADGSFPADEEVLQVEASVVLVDLGAEIEDVAVGKHCLEAQNVRAEGAVFYYVFASCVGRGVSPDLARALRSQVKRRLEAKRLDVLVELLEDDSGLAAHDGADLVEPLDFVHVLEVHDDLVEDWHAAADEASVSSLRDHCQLATVAVREYPRDLFGVVGTEEKLGVALVELAEAEVVRLYDAWVIRDSVGWQDGSEVGDILLVEDSEVLALEVVLPVLEANRPLQCSHYDINIPNNVELCQDVTGLTARKVMTVED